MSLVVAGCGREDQIVVYSVPKETAPSPAQPSQQPAPPAQTSSEITWQTPAGWKQLAGGQMRFAAFQASADDPNVLLTVVPLGTEAGDLKANVNRWEGQLGLPPSDEASLSKVAKPLEVNGVSGHLIDLTSPENPGQPRQRMLAAILPREQRIWFFKLAGPIDVVSREQSNFEAFVRSVRFDSKAQGDDSAPPSLDTSTSGESATWTAPPGWERQLDKPMRVATYRAGTDDSAAELIITRFAPGQAGGLLDNINRWRGQVGLEPIADLNRAERPRAIAINGHEAWIYDFTGNAKQGESPKRIRVALSIAGAKLWFFKLQGSADAVAQQQAAFDRFLNSVKFE
jgi:hypothetical protein